MKLSLTKMVVTGEYSLNSQKTICFSTLLWNLAFPISDLLGIMFVT